MHLPPGVPQMPCHLPGNGFYDLSPGGAKAGQSAGGLENKTHFPESVYRMQALCRDMPPKCGHGERCRVTHRDVAPQGKEKGRPFAPPFSSLLP